MKIKLLKITASLVTKLSIIALTAFVIVFWMGALLTNQWMAEEFKRHHSEKARSHHLYMLHEIEETMKNKGAEGIPAVLDVIRTSNGVKELRVFNL
ncbi:MAG: hypothetical protein HYR78_05690 [Nitrospirae bacterium]|nr:hypothetical protein [Nitrospirota bacterium]